MKIVYDLDAEDAIACQWHYMNIDGRWKRKLIGKLLTMSLLFFLLWLMWSLLG